MSVHMKASSVTSYLSYLKKLEELFEADLDDIVCSSALFRMAENTLSDLSISGKITNKEKSDYISALNEYKAFYGFDQKTPGWEQGVSIETKKRKRMTTALRKVKLPSHLGFPPILPGISAEYRQYDLEEVSGLKESVLREASVILNDIPNYTKDGPIGHRPDIVLSDLEVKKEYLTCGSKVLERIKSTISGSTASIAEEIEAALQQNNPIARIKEIRKMSVGKLKIKVDPKSKKLIEAVEGIAENDTYSSTTFGTYHPGGKYISIYYRTFDASTSE